jgi:Ca2+-binding RTX toxin-like protein
MPLYNGTSGNDTLSGSLGDDSLYGFAGQDRLTTGNGKDYVDGGPDNDQINGYFVDPTTKRYSYWASTGTKEIYGGDGDDFIYGSSDSDSLSGDAGNDYVVGAGGADTLRGGSGNDSLFGGNDSDTLTGGDGDDTLSAAAGSDSLDGGAGSDSLTGGDGDDSIVGGDGNDTLSAGAGSDSLYGGGGDDTFYSRTTDMASSFDDGGNVMDGGAGNDSLFGGNGSDTLTGGDGQDSLSGNVGGDSLDGGAGNDSLTGGDGDDSLYGGDGDDQITSQGAGDATLAGGNGNDTINAYSGTGKKFLDGGSGDDSLYGGNDSDTLIGGDGQDTLSGYSGNDSLDGGAGNDTLSGFAGSDSLDGGAGNDSLTGGDGDDSIVGGDDNDTLSAGAGNDSLYGGDGDDSFYSRTTDMASSFDDGGNVMDGGAGKDYFLGGNGSDTLIGGDGDDTLSGGAGSDSLDGGASNDSLTGGDGDDSLYGGDGDDQITSQGAGDATLAGGNGNDTINAYSGTGKKFLDGGSGDDSLYGGNDSDTLIGGNGQDTLSGYSSSDSLDGGAGNDSLTGGDGDDSIVGGDGNDLLIGGAGDDTLVGSTGRDTLEGGDGNDSYVIDNPLQFIRDTQGSDSAVVSTSFIKIPSSIEQVTYKQGALPLPYWIDALLPDSAAGLNFLNLLGSDKQFFYSFPSAKPSYNTDTKDALGWAPFSLAQQERVVQALAYIASITDLSFVRTSQPDALNTIAFASNDQTTSAGYARYPSSTSLGSDVLLDNSDSATNTALADGSYGALTLIHELGHALGLGHPFSSPDVDGTIAEPPHLSQTEDHTRWTVMSYTKSAEQYAIRYSPLDIAALQYLYGPSRSSRTGDDTYTISSIEPSFIWDGGGIDTISAEGCNQSCTIFLTPGFWGFAGSSRASLITAPGQITVNFGTLIENLIGSAQGDVLTGNDLRNRIEGGKGNDTLDGGLGSDTLIGGAGADTFVLSDGDLVSDFIAVEGDQLDFSSLADGESITLSTTAHVLILPMPANGKGFVATAISHTTAILVVDAVVPSVSKISATNGVTRIQPNGNISVLFSEVIALESGVIEIRSGSNQGALVESFATSDSNRVSVAGTTLTIDPSADLISGMDYFVVLPPGLVKDLAGNIHAGSSDLKIGVNSPASGTVAINGIAAQGQALMVSHSLTDADGIPTTGDGAIKYQWKAGGVAINGASTSTYILTQAEVGKAITVTARYVDLFGQAESVSSAETSSVVAPAKFWKDASKTPSETNKAGAVNLTDAISILKMIVGLSVNANAAPLSPYQAVAADFDQSGSVDLADAIGVLKMVVGLNAPAPTWKYFDDGKLASSHNAAQPLNHKAWSAGAAMDVPSTADSMVKLVGVLTGDLDGSWAG